VRRGTLIATRGDVKTGASYYRAADIFIMLSKFDHLGMVMLEANPSKNMDLNDNTVNLKLDNLCH
jgi:hypothetical protein